MRTAAAWCLAVLAFATASCRSDDVARVYDGHEVSGRFVSPEAYAAFAQAALLDAEGDRDAAAQAYERAVAEDSENATAWGRLGAMQCLRSRTAADRAFARAEAVDPDQKSPWLARAGCALERGDAHSAVAAATRAAALSPDDPEANQLVAATLERSGDVRGAERWRRGLSLLRPDEPIGAPQSPSPKEVYEHALARAERTDVERAAIRAHISSTDLSLEAAARGRLDVAGSVASAVLQADPSSSDARIAALTSADLGGDEGAFARLLTEVPQGTSTPSALGAELMEALISRRLGGEAARRWSEAYRSTPGH